MEKPNLPRIKTNCTNFHTGKKRPPLEGRQGGVWGFGIGIFAFHLNAIPFILAKICRGELHSPSDNPAHSSFGNPKVNGIAPKWE